MSGANSVCQRGGRMVVRNVLDRLSRPLIHRNQVAVCVPRFISRILAVARVQQLDLL